MKLIKPYILMLLAMVLFSCTNDVVLVDTIDEQEPVYGAISFEQGFVDKGTRAGIALSDYHSTMGVWGYRDPSSVNEHVFINQKVEFNTAEGWTYSPLKYWETTSNYDFYAYSPHNTTNVAIDNTRVHAYLININNIELTGANLQVPASSTEKMVFAGTADTDWMVARSAQKNISGSVRNTVQFNMQHILSKLNVRMRVSAAMESILGADAYVTVDKLTVGSLLSKGDFTQILSSTPVTDDEKTASLAEWTLDNEEITLSSTTSSKLASTHTYLIESLVLPQDIDATDEVYIEYTIHYADHTEKFKYSKLLREISPELNHLYTGYNYTVSFILDPATITFSANAAHWDDNATGSN